jgi:hypothetical protein
MRRPKWVVLIAGSTGSALRAVRPPNLHITPVVRRAARALLDITQPELAEAAGLGLSTIVDFEKSRRDVSRAAVHAMPCRRLWKRPEFISSQRTVADRGCGCECE